MKNIHKGVITIAERKDILKDIRETYGNALTKKEVGEYLGLGRHSTDNFLKDLTCYPVDKRKKAYLAIDIARKLDRCGNR